MDLNGHVKDVSRFTPVKLTSMFLSFLCLRPSLPPSLASSCCFSLKDSRSEDSENQDIIKQALMIKRSVNRKRLGPVNYKARWFVLTKSFLSYYEGSLEVKKKRPLENCRQAVLNRMVNAILYLYSRIRKKTKKQTSVASLLEAKEKRKQNCVIVLLAETRP